MTRLYLFVEGMDDIRFFESAVVPRLQTRYDAVHLIGYAGMKNVRVSSYLRAITALNDDYLLVADIDDAANTGTKKDIIRHRFPEIDPEKIIIVIMEIEGWYLAGLSADDSRILGLPDYPDTNRLIKEQFNALIPVRFDSRIDFLIELLHHFRPEEAVRKNTSYRYFYRRYLDDPNEFPERGVTFQEIISDHSQ